MNVKLLLLFLFFFLRTPLFAQNKAAPSTVMQLRGFIADSSTSIGIKGATVEIRFDNSALSEVYSKDSLHKLVVTQNGGLFEINNIPLSRKIVVTAYALGYKLNSREIYLTDDIKNNNPIVVDAGVIKLVKDYKALGAVVITSVSKQLMELDADKKIFNAEKSIAAQGGTAVDLLKNIPSVSVDADGNVTMRNSTPQLLIDGRPSLLTLEQIPADMIDKVELITNPSAKYDASASGGIINIVLKKNKRAGINGITSIGGGTPGLLNGNVNINFRQKKINLFGTANYNRSGGTTREETYRENKSNQMITDYFQQAARNERIRKFHSIRFGADYFLDKNNTLSFVQSFNGGHFQNEENQDQVYSDQFQNLNYTGLRNSTGFAAFKRSSSRLSFERKLSGDDHKLTADFTVNSGKGENNSAFTNNFYTPDGDVYASPIDVRNNGSDMSHQFTGQIDYNRKINDNKKVEAGLRSYYNSSKSYFNSYSIDESEVATKLPLGNNYKYSESVNAGYFNYANKWKSFSYQVGLRVELSKFSGTMIDSNYQFGYKFPDGFKNLNYSIFPSFFLTKSLDENQDIQFNYSKRIRRPGFWQVNPFVSINDPLNIRQGNVALKPEYTNSFELNYFNRFKNNNGSLLATVYFKNNVGDITQYSDTISNELFEQLNNASISSGAILNTYINAGYTNRTGAEIILQKKFWKHFDLNYSIDFQYRKTKARVNDLVLDNNGFNLGTKLTANYKIVSPGSFFNNFSFQLTGNYQGPRIIPQGRIKDRFFSDFAMRKEFLKKKTASLSFSINDIFNTRKFGTIYDTERFYQDSYRRWDARTFRLTFTYRFGNSNINLFQKRNNNERESDEEDGGQF